MLRTNLSTRPFYNERLVGLVIGIVAAAAVALTAFDAVRIYQLTQQRGRLAAEAAAAERQASELRQKGQAVRRELSSGDVDAVRVAAQEANGLIERRAFSWTELFNRFEATLPADVRIVAVQPQIDNDGRLLVMVTTVSRRVEDVDEFIGRLEGSGGFRGVLSRQEETQDDGTLRSVIQGYYSAATAVAPASDPAGEVR